MTPTIDDLNRIEAKQLLGTYETNIQIKNLIDNLMAKMQHIECNLGVDSTKKEIKEAKKEQLILLSKIKEYDVVKYDKLKPLFDDTKGI
tara:strand:+ start:548 stop:814 length:267 start_codon:yes stop_codon:yes gene_type:complete